MDQLEDVRLERTQLAHRLLALLRRQLLDGGVSADGRAGQTGERVDDVDGLASLLALGRLLKLGDDCARRRQAREAPQPVGSGGKRSGAAGRVPRLGAER